MRRDVINSLDNGGNLVRLLVRDFNCEFIFNCHNYFDDIETVEPQILSKRNIRVNLGRVNLIEVLDNSDNAIGHFFGIEKSLEEKLLESNGRRTFSFKAYNLPGETKSFG